MAETEFIAARVLPLTWAKLGQMGAHGRREIGAAHCDPTRRDLGDSALINWSRPVDSALCQRTLPLAVAHRS